MGSGFLHFHQKVPKTRKHSSRMHVYSLLSNCMWWPEPGRLISHLPCRGVGIHTHPNHHLVYPQVPCVGCGYTYPPTPDSPLVYLPHSSGTPAPLLWYTCPTPLVYLPHSSGIPAPHLWYTCPTPLLYLPSLYTHPWKAPGSRHSHPRRNLGPGIHTPLNRMIDTCENITFPQLRWRVGKIHQIRLRHSSVA